MVSAVLTVRVRDRVTPKTTSWSFDTMDDLRDFEAFWVEDAAERGSVPCDFPQWYVEDGVLRMDRNRTSNGSEKNNLYILTYTGQTYTNFEAEVDFSQEWVREMILFWLPGTGTVHQLCRAAQRGQSHRRVYRV